MEGQVEHQPLQGGGGGLRPGYQKVKHVYGEIVFGEALVILHGGEVNINKVHGIVSVESSSVLL